MNVPLNGTQETLGFWSHPIFPIEVADRRRIQIIEDRLELDREVLEGEVVGHVTTAEYGSQMLSLGGVHHITGGSKKEGRVTVDAMAALGNRQAVAFLPADGVERIIALRARGLAATSAAASKIARAVPSSRRQRGISSGRMSRVPRTAWFVSASSLMRRDRTTSRRARS